MSDQGLQKFKEDCNNLFSILILNTEMAISDIKDLEQTADIRKIKHSVDEILLCVEKGMVLNEAIQNYKSTKNIYDELHKIENKGSLNLLKTGLKKLGRK